MSKNYKQYAVLLVVGGFVAVFIVTIFLWINNRNQATEDSPSQQSIDTNLQTNDVELIAQDSTVKPNEESMRFSGWIDLPNIEELDINLEGTTEASANAVKEAILKGLKAGSLEEACKYYQEYIDRFPLTPDATVMRNMLGATLARLGRFDDARSVLKDAIVMAGDDRFVNVITLNLGYLETEAGNLDIAEELLQRLHAKPVPEIIDDDPYKVFPQAFEAPRFLAKVFQAKNQSEKADIVLKEAGELALELTHDNPDIKWLPSYVAGAYVRRINLALDGTPPDPEAALELANAFKREMPNYTGPLEYEEMVRSIDLWKRMQKLKAAK